MTAQIVDMQWCGRRLGSGGNSGFQAVNLAAVCGARKIILTGFDMGLTGGVHWHGPHVGLHNPDARMLKRCADLMDAAANQLERLGIEVINASRETALKAYRQMSMEEAL